jgi:hypothetical protein
MEFFLLATLVAFSAWKLRARDHRRRIALLGRHLSKYQIERHMETLTQGYLRALGESDPERREQIWSLLSSTEQELCRQCSRLAADFGRAEEPETRVSKLPVYVPFAAKLLPQATFDMRRALDLHARAISQAVAGSGAPSQKARTFRVSAELFLLQHTCHWFCRSRAVASARMLTRHQTSYQQLVASVLPETRAAYSALVGRP